uniref:Uncharacterized protein n=1 Tax=Candidatus Desulfatibia profunda TaxID=2841695 RepID=A0A8J6NRQ7_9BACT|nr:hypothetical protein [Candidatus Desulfatibia profunda]
MAEDLKETIEPEKVQEICGYVRTGVDFITAAIATGFTVDQSEDLHSKIDGDPQENFYIEFKAAVVRAMAHFEILQLQRIIQEGGASGAKWILEKRLPGRYGKQRKQLPGPGDFLEIEDGEPCQKAAKIGKDDFKAG